MVPRKWVCHHGLSGVPSWPGSVDHLAGMACFPSLKEYSGHHARSKPLGVVQATEPLVRPRQLILARFCYRSLRSSD
jgi:hypothetical protein